MNTPEENVRILISFSVQLWIVSKFLCSDKAEFCLFFPAKQRIEINKLRQGDHLILGFSIGGGIDQDPSQNPFSQNKSDKVSVLSSASNLSLKK